MKKKTKERLDRIEKRLQQLVEDVQRLKNPAHSTQGVKKKSITSKPKLAMKVATKKVSNAKKAASSKKAAVVPGTDAKKKTVKQAIPELSKNQVAAKNQRQPKAKPDLKAASKPTPKSMVRFSKPQIHKPKASTAPVVGVPTPTPATLEPSHSSHDGEPVN